MLDGNCLYICIKPIRSMVQFNPEVPWLSFSQCVSIDETNHHSIIASGAICSFMSIGVNFIKLKASMFGSYVFTMLSF